MPAVMLCTSCQHSDLPTSWAFHVPRQPAGWFPFHLGHVDMHVQAIALGRILKGGSAARLLTRVSITQRAVGAGLDWPWPCCPERPCGPLWPWKSAAESLVAPESRVGDGDPRLDPEDLSPEDL